MFTVYNSPIASSVKCKAKVFYVIVSLYIQAFPIGEKQFIKGSGTLLVRLYKDAGTPAIECSPTKF